MSIHELIEKYNSLGIAGILDHEKFNNISIVHHSTRIEGSTLTEVEARVLIDEGLTPKGKPLKDSLMVTDHYSALLYTLEQATKKRAVSVELIREINSLVVQNTGQVYNTVFGTIDSRTGAFRKGNVSAGSSYFPNFDKVEQLVKTMVLKINEIMQKPLTEDDKLNLAFDAHFNLVSIHPFYDGNGRTSRLLMNYIQAYFEMPLAIVYNESKAAYIQALIDARENNDINIFREFMSNEYSNMLKEEIRKFEEIEKPGKNKGFTLLF